MMIWLLFFLLVPQFALGDIFTSSESSSYELVKGRISLGYNRYNFHESLKNVLIRPEFEGRDFDEIIRKISSSKMLTLQYSSPTLADLYKHLESMGYLRLGMRYHQYEELEQAVNDPLAKLRKQAILACLRNRTGDTHSEDIDMAFKECFDQQEIPYKNLEDPENGNWTVKDKINVTDKALNRVAENHPGLNIIKNIVPTVLVDPDSVFIQGPKIKSRTLISNYQNDFLTVLQDLVKDSREHKDIASDKLAALSVASIPMTEGQIRNIAMLSDPAAALAMNKVAAELAYLKVVDLYVEASALFDRVMSHPAIEPGYKTLLNSSAEYVQKEIITLKEEKMRLGHYLDAMQAVVNTADQERLKLIDLSKKVSIGEKEKGLFKLNP